MGVLFLLMVIQPLGPLLAVAAIVVHMHIRLLRPGRIRSMVMQIHFKRSMQTGHEKSMQAGHDKSRILDQHLISIKT
jgi:hypothetical protein